MNGARYARLLAERFVLTKWYLDCATPGGDAFIGYWAELQWKKLSLRYASAMCFVGGRMHERATVRAGDPPAMHEGRVEWTSRGLDTRGEWVGSTAQSVDRVLFETADGHVAWRCLQPLAHARVAVAAHEFVGLGYSEIVTLTLPPWALPIEELRWGRAHFPERSVVWVDWTGKPACRLALVDGDEAPCVEVSDAVVATAKTRVTLSAGRPLREGPVSGSSVGRVPGVRAALSRAGLLIDEHKWLSTAKLVESGVEQSGIAVHEVVRWR